MTIGYVFRVLLARWRIIAAVTLTFTLLALVYILVRPPSYRAVAQVLVNVRSPDTISLVGDTAPIDQIQPDYVGTEQDVIRSERVGLAAVDLLKLTSDPDALTLYRKAKVSTPAPDFFADMLQRRLKILPSTTSRVISIQYQAKTPSAAAEVANAFADAFQEVSLELQTEPGRQSAGWFKKREAELLSQLQGAEVALSKRRAELGVTSADDTTDADQTRLANLSAQIAQAQVTAAATRARVGGGALPDINANPVVQSLQAQVAQARSDEQRLAQYAGPNNDDYVQAQRRVSSLQHDLAAQTALISRTTSAAAAQSTAGLDSLNDSLAAARTKVLQTKSYRDELSLLEQNVTDLKANYTLIQGKETQTELVGSGNQTNVTVLSRAVPPSKPANPPGLLVVSLGLIVGGAFGAMAALALEFLDTRMRDAGDVEMLLGVQNLSELRRLPSSASGGARIGSSRLLGRT